MLAETDMMSAGGVLSVVCCGIYDRSKRQACDVYSEICQLGYCFLANAFRCVLGCHEPLYDAYCGMSVDHSQLGVYEGGNYVPHSLSLEGRLYS